MLRWRQRRWWQLFFSFTEEGRTSWEPETHTTEVYWPRSGRLLSSRSTTGPGCLVGMTFESGDVHWKNGDYEVFFVKVFGRLFEARFMQVSLKKL